jgi:parvulin-like peptidyl-prolyl isomerase
MIRFRPFVLPFLAATLAAQVPAPTTQPGQPGQPPATNPEAVRPETPQERVQKLQEQADRLQRELEGIRAIEKGGGIAAQVKHFLKERALQTAAFAPPAGGSRPAAGGRRGSRLLGDAEKSTLAADVIFTVDGLPATKAEFDGLFDYLKSYPREETDDALKSRAVLELVRLKAVQAAFEKNLQAAQAKIVRAEAKLKQGADFAAVAKELSDCPSKDNGGELGLVGRESVDLLTCKAAFGLKVGEVSPVVATENGFTIVRVTGQEKGETPAKDRVRVSRILAAYTPAQEELRAVQMRVNSGQVDLGFVSDEYRKFTPDVLKN